MNIQDNMGLFGSLPNEVICSILSSLSYEDATCLELTCKGLHQIVKEAIFDQVLKGSSALDKHQLALRYKNLCSSQLKKTGPFSLEETFRLQENMNRYTKIAIDLRTQQETNSQQLRNMMHDLPV